MAINELWSRILIDSYNDPGVHNCFYRGECLGTSADAIPSCSSMFIDIFIGDYVTIDGVNYRIAGFNYFGGTPNVGNHIVMVPDTCLSGGVAMHSSAATTQGYTGSTMFTSGLTSAKSIISTAFGSRLEPMDLVEVSGATNGCASEVEIKRGLICENMTEQMVYGSHIFAPNRQGTVTAYNQTYEKTQLPLFKFRPDLIPASNSDYWLRDITGTATFAAVQSDGMAMCLSPDMLSGIRPYFIIQ